MAKKGGSVKRVLLTLVLLVLLVVVFILLGGGRMLKSAGGWMTGVGRNADVVKHQMEEKASKTGQAVEKVIETVKPGENKGEKK